MRADIYTDLNTADATGTTLSGAILDSGTHGTTAGWGVSPATPTGLTIGAHLKDRNDVVVVGGTTYAANSTCRSFSILHTSPNNFIYGDLEIPLGHRAATVAGFIKLGPTTASSDLWDWVMIKGAISAQYCVMQLRTNGGSQYALNIETNPGGSTQHSADLTVSANTTYWFCLRGDYNTGIARLGIWETVGWTKFGGLLATMTTGEDIQFIDVGQRENGTESGKTSFIEQIVIDYTEALFPLGPSAITADPSRASTKGRKLFKVRASL
jgi:hypothetical protein